MHSLGKEISLITDPKMKQERRPENGILHNSKWQRHSFELGVMEFICDGLSGLLSWHSAPLPIIIHIHIYDIIFSFSKSRNDILKSEGSIKHNKVFSYGRAGF